MFSMTLAWSENPYEQSSLKNYFYFAIPNYQTQRQGGQSVNIYVKYAYKQGLPTASYVDYRLMRKEILEYMEPSAEYPSPTFWEIIAAQMGKRMMEDYPIEGVSVQLEVLDNPNPQAYEPGNHGPIYTLGKIEPIANLH